jgi:hypothetical protein
LTRLDFKSYPSHALRQTLGIALRILALVAAKAIALVETFNLDVSTWWRRS